jgi:hypothetical protein
MQGDGQNAQHQVQLLAFNGQLCGCYYIQVVCSFTYGKDGVPFKLEAGCAAGPV